MLTSFNEESIRFSPLNVNLWDENVVDVPSDSPRYFTCTKNWQYSDKCIIIR